jgi:hypothetical protein
VPNVFPPASRARTARYGSEVEAAMAVSNPVEAAEATGESWSAVFPPSNCQDAMPVAPFQLA